MEMPLPWEVGFLRDVLGDNGDDRIGTGFLAWRGPVPPMPPPPPPPTASAPAPTAARSGPQRPFAAPSLGEPLRNAARCDFVPASKRRRTKLTLGDADDEARTAAILKVRTIIDETDGKCIVAQQVSQQRDPGAVLDLIRDIIATKSTGTVIKRANSAFQYVRWARTAGGQCSFPPSEEDAYAYAAAMRSSGAAATRVTGFMEACNFFGTLLGFDATPIASSTRVRGAAALLYQGKRPTRKRPALTVEALIILENAVFDASLPSARVFAGFVLFCVYCRLRHTDAARISVEPRVDDGGDEGAAFVEADVSYLHWKTGRSRMHQGNLIPVAGPAIGITGRLWATEWLAARADAGLEASVDKCLMPAPLAGGEWTSTRLGPWDCTLWLREVLVSGGLTAAKASLFGSHSMKATMLSWAAKAGINAPHRRLLGGHIKPGDKSVLDYSRDSLAGPLAKLSKVLDCVAPGEFKPDATRSG